jgi:hypothetical protein
MNDYARKPPGSDCPPLPDNPADQPRAPKDDCTKPETCKPPVLTPPDPCPPPSDCNCPTTPGPTSTCLDRLVDERSGRIARAEKGKAYVTALQNFQAKAKAASQSYTRDAYDSLMKQWKQEDRDIADLIRRLVCAVPCWKCILECYVCPLLNDVHTSAEWLYGDGSLYSEVHNLYDLQYWLVRDVDFKTRTFNRINDVLTAWSDPAKTITANLQANAKLISSSNNSLGTAAPQVVYDVFFRLIPMHLAIAPPAGPHHTTRIAKQFTEFCCCDKGKPDDCCGPDVGERSFRQQLIGPQPYLIDPNDYFKLICCLVEKRYHPAQDALAAAQAALDTINADIARRTAQLANYAKTFDSDAKGRIPSVVICCDSQLPPPDPTPTLGHSA